MHLLYDLYYALMPIPISPMLALFVVLTKSVSGHLHSGNVHDWSGQEASICFLQNARQFSYCDD